MPLSQLQLLVFIVLLPGRLGHLHPPAWGEILCVFALLLAGFCWVVCSLQIFWDLFSLLPAWIKAPCHITTIVTCITIVASIRCRHDQRPEFSFICICHALFMHPPCFGAK